MLPLAGKKRNGHNNELTEEREKNKSQIVIVERNSYK